jgi:YVTN family beta-propeller protein
VVVNTTTNQVVKTFRLVDDLLRDTAMTMRPGGSTAYVAMGIRRSIAVIDTTADTLQSSIPISVGVDNLIVHPDGSKIYATSSEHDQLIIVDTTIRTQIASVKIPSPATFGESKPEGMSIHPDGSKIYIVNGQDDDVVVLDANTNGLIGFIPVGRSPRALGQFIKPAARIGGGPIATLENPAPGSFQSGIGLISGWVCEAQVIEVEIDGQRVRAAYGTTRGDTVGVCGDDNNGFGLTFNWNLLGGGVHVVRALADGNEFGRATFTVATLGLGEFPRGLSGQFALSGFPQAGTTTQVQWQESAQNFVIRGTSGRGGGSSSGPLRVLENPQPGSFQSGIGLISGWVCAATLIEIEMSVNEMRVNLSWRRNRVFEKKRSSVHGITAGTCATCSHVATISGGSQWQRLMLRQA